MKYKFRTRNNILFPDTWLKAKQPLLVLDGMSYDRVDSNKVPAGHSSVPVKLIDNGVEYEAMMVAGSVGLCCTSSGREVDGDPKGLDTISMETGWWIFEKKSKTVMDAE